MASSEIDRWNQLYRHRRWGHWPSEAIVRAVMRSRTAPGRIILEVGCGAGAQLRFLAEEGWTGIGADISSEALDQASLFLPGLGIANRLLQADGCHLPIRSSSVSGVIDCETFVHSQYEDMVRLWREAARVLHPGGWVVSQSFDSDTDPSALDYVGGATLLGSSDLRELAANAGLSVVSQETFTRSGATVISETLTIAFKSAL